MTKTCTKCGVEKDLELFPTAKRYADGRRNYCKKCHSEYMTSYYKDNPDKLKTEAKIRAQKNRTNWKRHRMLEVEIGRAHV